MRGAAASPFPRKFPRRGEIYDVDLGEPRGSAQAGRRPTVIVSNDVNNEHAPTITVAAITKTIPAKPYPFTVFLPAGTLRFDGTILCNQVLTLDKRDLLTHRGELDSSLMRQVDKALSVALGLPRARTAEAAKSGA